MPVPGTAGRIVPLLVMAIVFAGCVDPTPRRRVRIVGAVETVRVEEAALYFDAVIDPDRKSTSINTVELQIGDASTEPLRNIGKRVRFFVQNERGERQVINTRISSVVTDADTRSGSESAEAKRNVPVYRVPLTLSVADIERLVEVELSNRETDAHKLVVGRDWVGDDLRVDRRRSSAN